MSDIGIYHRPPSSMYHLVRDNPQAISISADRSRFYGVRIGKEDFDPQIFRVGTLLSAAPQGCREKPIVGSCRNGAQHSSRVLHVATGRNRHPVKWSDSPSMSDMSIYRHPVVLKFNPS